jgi:hypothetical protein
VCVCVCVCVRESVKKNLAPPSHFQTKLKIILGDSGLGKLRLRSSLTCGFKGEEERRLQG